MLPTWGTGAVHHTTDVVDTDCGALHDRYTLGIPRNFVVSPESNRISVGAARYDAATTA